jgi:putative SOS response-associated peptidase YedK
MPAAVNPDIARTGSPVHAGAMCNLYNVTTTQAAIIAFTRAMRDIAGNLEPSIDVYPDRMAPIVRNAQDGVRELARVRWGLPSSSQALFMATKKRAEKIQAKGVPVDFQAMLKMEPDGGTTNVRNTSSKHWTRWLGVESRCVVPVTSFAEPDPANRGERGTPNAWFALAEDWPLMFFAGVWVPAWTSVRKIKTGVETLDLFAFLTTEPSVPVAMVHPKAMPAILTTQAEVETWLTAPWSEASALQRPLPDGTLQLVERPKAAA